MSKKSAKETAPEVTPEAAPEAAPAPAPEAAPPEAPKAEAPKAPEGPQLGEQVIEGRKVRVSLRNAAGDVAVEYLD